MSTTDSTADGQSLFTGLPTGVLPYVAIVAALVSTYIHLSMAPMIMQFDQTQGILFVLAGLGFLAGIAVYLTRFWRREFYLVAIGFSLAQVAAFFVMGGPLNDMAIASKLAEVVFALAAAALYLGETDVLS
ncbi:DUF7475 family protein [Haloarcula salina]|uniref:DUF7475 family protein n=1 Tax=Haloarcula salina TaxID=1429914 RepID=UPI003C704F9E